MKLTIEKLSVKIKAFSLECSGFTFSDRDHVIIKAPNGSGKSVFLKSIVGLIETNQRKIQINDQDIKVVRLSNMAAVYLGEEFLIPFYKPLEYFGLVGKVRGLNVEQINRSIDNISDTFEQSWPDKYIRELSTGMKKRVGMAGSLIGNPELILWDEPFQNLDDEAQNLVHKFIDNDKRLIIYTSPESMNLPYTNILTIESGEVIAM